MAKVTASREELDFKPIQINITLESYVEALALYEMVNYSTAVVRSVKGIVGIDEEKLESILYGIFTELRPHVRGNVDEDF